MSYLVKMLLIRLRLCELSGHAGLAQASERASLRRDGAPQKEMLLFVCRSDSPLVSEESYPASGEQPAG